MDDGQCNLIYYDPRASFDLVLSSETYQSLTLSDGHPQRSNQKLIHDGEVNQNVKAVLPSFQEGMQYFTHVSAATQPPCALRKLKRIITTACSRALTDFPTSPPMQEQYCLRV